MSSRRDKEKGKKEERKLRKAEREAEREERRDRRAAATDGLGGAIAAAAVPSKGAQKIRTPPPSVSSPNEKGPAANSSPSAITSPVLKRRGRDHRVEETVSSSSSISEDSSEDETSAVEAKTITNAGEKLKKRSCVQVESNYVRFQVESNYFLLNIPKAFFLFSDILCVTAAGHSCY